MTTKLFEYIVAVSITLALPAAAFAQTGESQLMRLSLGGNQIAITSATLVNINAQQAARQNRTSGGRAYLITRMPDASSKLIRDSASAGRVFPSATIATGVATEDDKTAWTTMHTFGKMYVASYSSNPNSAGGTTESFLIFFESVSQ